MEIDQEGYDMWLLTRPLCVQEIAKRFHPTQPVLWRGRPMFVIGFEEFFKENKAGLILSPVNPAEDYDEALAVRVVVCPHLLDEVVAAL